jgi:hypothetical protein
MLSSLQQELNRIQLLISYILTQVRPMPAAKNRVARNPHGGELAEE